MESYDTNRLLAHEDEKFRNLLKSRGEAFPKSPIRYTNRLEEADDIIDRKIEAKTDILSASPRVHSDPMSGWPSHMEEDPQEGLSSAIHESQVQFLNLRKLTNQKNCMSPV